MTRNVEDHDMQDRAAGWQGDVRPDAGAEGPDRIGGGPGTGRGGRLRARIVERFAPVQLVLEDQSARHAGHAGVRESGPSAAAGETHYAMLVVSEAFAGMGRVQRSRLVHAVLDDEFRAGLHALSLTLRTPEEQRRQDATSGIV